MQDFCTSHVEYLRRREHVECFKGPVVVSEAFFVTEYVSGACLGLEVPSNVAIGKVSLGTSRRLLEPCIVAGKSYSRLFLLQKRLSTSCQTLSSLAHLIQTQLHQYATNLLSVILAKKDESLLAAVTALKSSFASLHFLDESMESIDVMTRDHAKHSHGYIASHAVDAVTDLFSKTRLFSPVSTLILHAAVEPYCRILLHYMQTGEVHDRFKETFLSDKEHCPKALCSVQLKIVRIGRTSYYLKQMGLGHQLALDVQKEEEEENRLANLVEWVERVYKKVCSHLVRIVLVDRGGLDVCHEMRLHMRGPSSKDVQWPLTSMLCTERNSELYLSAFTFLDTLRSCQKQLAHMSNDGSFGSLFFLRFRHKALHVVSSLLSVIMLRLEEDSWPRFEQVLLQCPDFEEMITAHDNFVQRVADVCLQHQDSKALRNAVRGILDCCEKFCLFKVDQTDAMDADFDKNVLLLKTVLNGVLQQRKILYLQSLLEYLGGAA